MDHPECAVAIAHGTGEHAHRGQVIDLVELAPALVHLLPDGVEVLGTPGDLGLDAHLAELVVQERDELVDLRLALEAPLGHSAHELLVVLGIQDPQGQVLELGLHLGHAEAVGERRVDVERLLGDLLGLLGGQEVERPHIVQAIGELDHEHAQVARHGHEHLAVVLRLALLAGGEGELADLRDAVDEVGDLGPELPLEIALGRVRVLEDVVQEPRRHRDHVHLEVHEQAGHLERMREIGLAGGALLTLVGLLREPVGAGQ
jgi:hypothetical protein